MYYRVQGTLATADGTTVNGARIVEATLVSTPAAGAEIVLAYSNRDYQDERWHWDTQPTIEYLADYVLPPGQWFLSGNDGWINSPNSSSPWGPLKSAYSVWGFCIPSAAY